MEALPISHSGSAAYRTVLRYREFFSIVADELKYRVKATAIVMGSQIHES
jgi:hypothetical protein